MQLELLVPIELFFHKITFNKKMFKTASLFLDSFPLLKAELQELGMAELETIYAEEKFIKSEPVRLEDQLRRCKQLTSTLLTLKK